MAYISHTKFVKLATLIEKLITSIGGSFTHCIFLTGKVCEWCKGYAA